MTASVSPVSQPQKFVVVFFRASNYLFVRVSWYWTDLVTKILFFVFFVFFNFVFRSTVITCMSMLSRFFFLAVGKKWANILTFLSRRENPCTVEVGT